MCKGNVHLVGIFLLEKEVDQGSLETVVYVVRSQSRDNESACRCSKRVKQNKLLLSFFLFSFKVQTKIYATFFTRSERGQIIEREYVRARVCVSVCVCVCVCV